jgi:hypothetical protein
MPELDRLLKRIDPSASLEQTAKQIDKAVNTFRLNKASTENWNEFETCLAEFYCHLENMSLSKNRQTHQDMDYDRSRRLLLEEYGPNGEKIAFEMAQKGIDGGFYAVLKIIAGRLTNYYSQNQVRYLVDEFWNNLGYDERITAAKQYREKYGHLIPPQYTEGSIEYLTSQLPKILEEHPGMIQRMRRVGR